MKIIALIFITVLIIYLIFQLAWEIFSLKYKKTCVNIADIPEDTLLKFIEQYEMDYFEKAMKHAMHGSYYRIMEINADPHPDYDDLYKAVLVLEKAKNLYRQHMEMSMKEPAIMRAVRQVRKAENLQ